MADQDYYAVIAQVIPVLLLAVTVDAGVTRLARRARTLRLLIYFTIGSGFVGELAAIQVLRRPDNAGTTTELLCSLPAAFLLGVLAGSLVMRLQTDELD